MTSASLTIVGRPTVSMGLIDGDYPFFAVPPVDDHDDVEGSLPLHQQEQLLQQVGFECGLFNNFC